MIRMKVNFTESQAAALKRIAAREQVSVAELVRRAIDLGMDSKPEPTHLVTQPTDGVTAQICEVE